MHICSLGDSISIDAYTKVSGGGAAKQLARRFGASHQDLTADGRTTLQVLSDLARIESKPDLITLTIGGNDLLEYLTFTVVAAHDWNDVVSPVLARVASILDRLARFNAPIVLNTIYDPTDGDDTKFQLMSFPETTRQGFDLFNNGIRAFANRPGVCLADLESLFMGHGFWSLEPWLTEVIEPNLAGATAIANLWQQVATPLLARCA